MNSEQKLGVEFGKISEIQQTIIEVSKYGLF